MSLMSSVMELEREVAQLKRECDELRLLAMIRERDLQVAALLIRDLTWEPIETYLTAPHNGHHGAYWPTVFLAHEDNRWRRMGQYDPMTKSWYYSQTSENAQYQTDDAPTHWMMLPRLPAKNFIDSIL